MKIRVIALIVPLLTLGAAGAAGAIEVVNSNNSQKEVFVSWDFSTADGTFVSGSVQGIHRRGGEPFVAVFEVSGTPIVCDNGTPDDPSDDFGGTHVEFLNGSGPGTVTIDGQYRAASASAVLDLFVDSFDDCFFFPEHGSGGTVIEDVPVALEATATGPLARSTSSSGFHIPSEINETVRFDARFRTGTGTATVGEMDRSGFAQIGKVSWRSHSNTSP